MGSTSFLYHSNTNFLFSRLNDDKHWSSDVFIGSIIGYFTAQLVLKDTPFNFQFFSRFIEDGFCYDFKRNTFDREATLNIDGEYDYLDYPQTQVYKFK
jgi:hypothetical protein